MQPDDVVNREFLGAAPDRGHSGRGRRATGARGAVLLASYLPASFVGRRPDYRGEEWVGRSRESERPGMVAHSFRWIRQAAARGLAAARVHPPPLTPRGQVWVAIRKLG